MNLSPQWVQVFEEAGIEAIHWSRIGDPAASDREIFDSARERESIVFTNDLDFGTILNHSKQEKPSVIQLRTADVSPRAQGATVVRVSRKFEEELLRGAIITIDPGRERIRVLPMSR